MATQAIPPVDTPPETNRIAPIKGMGRTLGAKFFMLCILALLSYIPMQMVFSLQQERSWTARQAAVEIGQMTGGAQKVSGPFIELPLLVTGTDGKPFRRVAVFLPDDLVAENKLATEIRHRSIFQVPVYRNTLKIKARFNPVDAALAAPETMKPLWSEAVLVIGIADTRAIVSRVSADFGQGRNVEFQSGVPAGPKSGIHAPLKGIDLSKPLEVAIDMQINGSSRFSLSALGKTSLITMESGWPHPSFQGEFLPEQRSIGDKGFSAVWRSSALARKLPAVFFINDNAAQSCCGGSDSSFNGKDEIRVELYTPAGLYQQVERALKYGMLFIGGMFLAVFGIEAASRAKIHAAQYVLFGLALVLFYVLLLSFAEHIGFDAAYWIASGATTALTAAYVGGILRSAMRGGGMFVILAIAYGLIYMLLRMEDYALLLGSVAVFIVLAALMFATLRIDWSAIPANKFTGKD